MPIEKELDAETQRLLEQGYIIDEDRPDQFVPERLPTQSPGTGRAPPKVERGYEHRKRRR